MKPSGASSPVPVNATPRVNEQPSSASAVPAAVARKRTEPATGQAVACASCPSQAYFDKFQRTFGVPLQFPSLDVLEGMYTKRGYSDPNHMETEGREVYSAWLGRQLAQ